MTGSVYKDYALLKNGFPGENIVNGSVIAIKTHEFGPTALHQFDRAILLVRDPFEALQVSESCRLGFYCLTGAVVTLSTVVNPRKYN